MKSPNRNSNGWNNESYPKDDGQKKYQDLKRESMILEEGFGFSKSCEITQLNQKL